MEYNQQTKPLNHESLCYTLEINTYRKSTTLQKKKNVQAKYVAFT